MGFRREDGAVNVLIIGGAVDGGEMDVDSLGVNWWFTRSALLGVNYRHVNLDRFGTRGDSSGLNTRLLLILQ